MASGVLATGNSLSVALFTPTSVACADKITAINNSKSLLKLSSVVGLGRWAFKRLKISIRFCLFMVVFGLINWRVNRWLPWLVREPVGPLYFLWQGALRFVAAGAIAVRHRLQWQFDIGFVRAPRLVRWPLLVALTRRGLGPCWQCMFSLAPSMRPLRRALLAQIGRASCRERVEYRHEERVGMQSKE